jgi:hypothetical protein
MADWRSPELVEMQDAMGDRPDGELSERALEYRKLFRKNRLGYVKAVKDVERKDSASYKEREMARLEKAKTRAGLGGEVLKDDATEDVLRLIDRILEGAAGV